jgi:hypothetical protein
VTADCVLIASLALTASLDLPRESDLIVTLAYQDGSSDSGHPVEAVTVVVDGAAVEEVLVFPRSGKTDYAAVVGPLPAGAHTIALRDSQLWPSALSQSRDLKVRIVAPIDDDAAIVRYAPAIWARADTVGAATDLPLVLYAESDEDTRDGGRRLTYSLIFSNEDGGTPTRALMARWGRASDIEWAYAVRLANGQRVEETFQAANHGTQPFRGDHVGTHPVLLVATLNNVFSDRGRGAALIRPVPRSVDLRRATRESVMDLEPWTYRVMARELAAEHKIESGPAGPLDPDLAADPRSYVFVEAKLQLDRAAVAAVVEDEARVSHASHLGVIELTVARDGWVRVAVPTDGARPVGVGWECLPVGGTLPRRDAARPACHIEATRAFQLQSDYRPGPNLVQPATLVLGPGETKLLPPAAGKR